MGVLSLFPLQALFCLLSGRHRGYRRRLNGKSEVGSDLDKYTVSTQRIGRERSHQIGRKEERFEEGRDLTGRKQERQMRSYWCCSWKESKTQPP